MQKQKGLRNVRVLATAAMLGALSVVIGIFCKNFLNFGAGMFRVTFENFPIILSGILFGPAVGASVGIISDMVSYFLSTQSFAISPIVTLGAALVGAVSGIVSNYIIKKRGVAQVLISVIAAHAIGSLLVKTFGIYAYYNISYGLMLLYRLPTYTVIAALESSAICLILKHKAFRKYTRYQNELQ
jgi:ECF transporter S component (folate family)